jgi:hypothetical protein
MSAFDRRLQGVSSSHSECIPRGPQLTRGMVAIEFNVTWLGPMK